MPGARVTAAWHTTNTAAGGRSSRFAGGGTLHCHQDGCCVAAASFVRGRRGASPQRSRRAGSPGPVGAAAGGFALGCGVGWPPDCSRNTAAGKKCEPDRAVATVSAQREVEGTPRGSCGECGCRILLVGPGLEGGLCKPCRTEAAAATAEWPAPSASRAPATASSGPAAGGAVTIPSTDRPVTVPPPKSTSRVSWRSGARSSSGTLVRAAPVAARAPTPAACSATCAGSRPHDSGHPGLPPSPGARGGAAVPWRPSPRVRN